MHVVDDPRRIGDGARIVDVVALLRQDGIISEKQMQKLQAMVGFRNILVHEWLDLKIMVTVIEKDVRELLDFANAALKAAG